MGHYHAETRPKGTPQVPLLKKSNSGARTGGSFRAGAWTPSHGRRKPWGGRVPRGPC